MKICCLEEDVPHYDDEGILGNSGSENIIALNISSYKIYIVQNSGCQCEISSLLWWWTDIRAYLSTVNDHILTLVTAQKHS